MPIPLHQYGSKLLAALLFSTMCHCASPVKLLSTSCEGTDTYELGRQHGTQGLKFPNRETLSSPIYECVPVTLGEKRQRYEIGYNSGLADYCTKEGGFTIGRSDLSYNNVCPTLSERDFLLGYEMGKEVRRTQLENQKLENQISLLEKTLETMSPRSQDSAELVSQISRLQQQLNRNQKKIRTQSL